MKFFIYSLSILLLAPCNNKNVSNAKNTQDNSKVMITYQRTPCFGKCPAFTMTINGANKTITYTGKSNVAKLGNYTKPISDDQLSMFVAAFDNADFFNFKDKYDSNITDVPSKYIGYTKDGRAKNIEDMIGAPGELRDLEKLLDTIADSDGWVKSDDSKH
jgi:hypothetical protein